MEIERKFLLRRNPEGIEIGTGEQIEQGYVFDEPIEMRLRSRAGRFLLSVKTTGSIAREEWEKEIPKWVYESLWSKVGWRIVRKTRYLMRFDERELELDVYQGPLDGLITLECEFASLEDAQSFSLPTVFSDAVEVTDDARYKNKHLATNGIPSRQ